MQLIFCNQIFFYLLIQLWLPAFLCPTGGTGSTSTFYQKCLFAFFQIDALPILKRTSWNSILAGRFIKA